MEQARAFLQQADGQGNSLYDQLAALVVALSKKDKVDAAGLLAASAQIKEAALPVAVPEEILPTSSSPASEKLLAALNQVAALAKPSASTPLAAPRVEEKKEAGDDADEEETPAVNYPAREGNAPPSERNFVADARMLAWGGVDLGESNTAKLALSIRELAATNGLQQVRFFGKVLGTRGDYYIVECATPAEFVASDKIRVSAELKAAKAAKTPVAELDTSEPWGEGVNAFAYYVTTDPATSSSGWKLLPRAQPEWIRTARQMRRFFTGDLAAAVNGYPSFPWREAAYLRATIALIASECTVAPAGVFAQDDVEGVTPAPIKFDPEYTGENQKKPEDLWVRAEGKTDAADRAASAANWQLIVAAIRQGKDAKGVNNGGRVSKWTPPEKGEDEEANENDYTPDDDDEEGPDGVLRGLDEAKSDLDEFKNGDGEGTTPWKFKLCTSFGKFPEKRRSAIVAAQSLEWPGAVCVSDGAQFCNVYVGTGQKRLGSAYSPPLPPPVQGEFAAPAGDDEEAAPPANGIAEQKDPRQPAEGGEGEEGA